MRVGPDVAQRVDGEQGPRGHQRQDPVLIEGQPLLAAGEQSQPRDEPVREAGGQALQRLDVAAAEAVARHAAAARALGHHQGEASIQGASPQGRLAAARVAGDHQVSTVDPGQRDQVVHDAGSAPGPDRQGGPVSIRVRGLGRSHAPGCVGGDDGGIVARDDVPPTGGLLGQRLVEHAAVVDVHDHGERPGAGRTLQAEVQLDRAQAQLQQLTGGPGRLLLAQLACGDASTRGRGWRVTVLIALEHPADRHPSPWPVGPRAHAADFHPSPWPVTSRARALEWAGELVLGREPIRAGWTDRGRFGLRRPSTSDAQAAQSEEQNRPGADGHHVPLHAEPVRRHPASRWICCSSRSR